MTTDLPLLRRAAAFVQDEGAVTAIEYALLAALIALVALIGIASTGQSLGALYTRWSEAVLGALSG